MPYLKTLKKSRPFPDFEEYVVSTSVYTPYIILWSNIKKSALSANTPYPRTSIHRIEGAQYAIPKKSNTPNQRSSIRRIQEVRYAVSDSAQENSRIFYSWSLRQTTLIRRIEFQYAEPTESCKFPIKVLYYSKVLGWFHVEDCLNLLSVFPNSHDVDDVYHELTLFDSESTFSCVQLHVDPSKVNADLSSKLLVYRCLIGVAYWLRPRLCSASFLEMSVMSEGFQAKTLRLFASS
ncbi:hypothetical protein Tco_1124725 [Tanacetum coccineum]|uniref:Uncharacterized protein n=1 Tax=Tanacetum coccineum TaxID=301880 RepID=A0ABQ5J704_9ASTR